MRQFTDLPMTLLPMLFRANARNLLFSSFLIFHFTLSAQDIPYTRQILDTLCSPFTHGRGYVKKGDKIAANYIANEFKKFGLKAFEGNYFQQFDVSVNTFPSKIKMATDGKELMAGKDFLVHPNSKGIEGTFDISWLTAKEMNSPRRMQKFWDTDVSNNVIIIDREGVDERAKFFTDLIAKFGPDKSKAIIFIDTNKLTHAVSVSQSDFTIIQAKKSAIPAKTQKMTLKIEAEFIEKYTTQNIIGYVEGTEFPDSFIVFSAHYDHLGRLGTETYFPGANDNASGTAMLLNLANHYIKNSAKYSVAFMAFGAEELGLLGSKHYTENPLFPIGKIKFLINLDILGTGDEGITVVNAPEHPKQFKTMLKINDEKQYLVQIKKRGKSANSDHHHFSEKGVPAFFIYTRGGIKAYHDIYDRAETLPLTEFEDVFRLLKDFVEEF